MPSPTVRDSTITGSTSNSTTNSIAATAPTMGDGDWLIAFVSKQNTGDLTSVPSGWSYLERAESGNRTDVYVRFVPVASSEPGTYTWSWTTAVQAHVVIASVQNADPTYPFHAVRTYRLTVSSTARAVPRAMMHPLDGLSMTFLGTNGNTAASAVPSGHSTHEDRSTGTGSGSSTRGILTSLSLTMDAASPGDYTISPGRTAITVHVVWRSAEEVTPFGLRNHRVNSGSGTSMTPLWPLAWQEGDRLWVLMCQIGATSPTITPPSGGWQLVAREDLSTVTIALYALVLEPGDTAAAWTWGASTTTWAIVAFSTSRAELVAITTADDADNSSTLLAPALTAPAQAKEAIVFHAVAMNRASNISSGGPAGFDFMGHVNNFEIDTASQTMIFVSKVDTAANPAQASWVMANTGNCVGMTWEIGDYIPFRLSPYIQLLPQ